MTTKEFKPVFPLEDDFSAKVVQNPVDKFWRLPVADSHNGILVKAPFDCRVKELITIPEQESYFGTDYWPGYQTRYTPYQVVYESKNYLFSIVGILPNDKSKNIGAKFKAGENLGRTLSKDSGTAFAYYDLSKPELDEATGEQLRDATPIEADSTNFEIRGEQPEPKSKAAKTFTLIKVVGVIIAGAYAYKLVKGK